MREDQSPKEASGRIFYGWWIVAVCFLVLVVHSGCAFYSFARFTTTFTEIAAFGSSVGAIGFAASVYMLILGLTGPAVGRLSDRLGPKKVIIGGAVIAGAGLMLLSLASQVWHLYLLYGVVGLGMSGAGVVPVSATISKWFTKRRGAAMGIATAGIALGAFLALLTDLIIDAASWQTAFLVLGLITWALIILPTTLVMKTRPSDVGLLPDGAVPPDEVAIAEMEAAPGAEVSFDIEPAWTVTRAMRTASFWLMLVAFFLVGAVIAGVLQHEDRFLTIMEVSIPATLGLALTGGIGGLGKLAFGFLADRLSPKYTAIICIALQLVGLAILIIAQMMTQNVAMVWAFVIVFGFAMGGNITLQPLVTGQLFGTASFGAIFGWVVLIAAVGSALGPSLMGVIYDASGSYSVGFMTFLGVYAVAITALFFARRPKPIGQNTTS